jgi:hypothetical protein
MTTQRMTKSATAAQALNGAIVNAGDSRQPT